MKTLRLEGSVKNTDLLDFSVFDKKEKLYKKTYGSSLFSPLVSLNPSH